jgi:chromosome segregation protein
VLDEVEAALDDTNLHRLIGLLDQLRAASQLIIITHQKPTMEIADALYGVSMRGDGISQVISQRLRGKDEPRPLVPQVDDPPLPEVDDRPLPVPSPVAESSPPVASPVAESSSPVVESPSP